MRLLSISRIVSRIQVAHAANPQRARATFFAILAIVVVLLSIKYAAKISKPGDTGLQTRSAFLRWRAMINNVFQGENIYVSGNEYPNPPIMAILLKPFAALPPVTGAMSWFFVKVFMAVLAAMWVFRLCRGRSDDPANITRTDLAFGAAIVLCLPAILGDLSHNNVNIFILFLVVATLEAFRRGWDIVAGLTLGLAVACKVTPMLFVAYFAWKRCWRALFASLAGLVLWLAVVPGLTFGWERNRELMTDWYSLMIERPLLKGEITTEHPNQAITGYVYRLFTHSPSFVEYPNNILTPAEYHNITDIGRPAAWVVVKALTALFVLAVVCLCWHPVRKRTDARHGWRFTAECGFICLGMLLFSERTWKHHTVVLLIPLAALAYAVAVVELPGRVRNFILGVLCASLVLMAGPGLLPRRPADLAMVYGTHTIALVLQTVAVGLLLACRSGREGDLCGLHDSAKQPIPI